MKRLTLTLAAAFTVALSTLILHGCSGRDVNSIGDPHFAPDGTPLDSAAECFEPRQPAEVKLYIETSGSMNGFFRANRPNRFKETVWSVFSGLQPLTDGNVLTLSQGGTSDAPTGIGAFRGKMNGGGFVSNTATHIPAMLAGIAGDTDPGRGQVAVLVSDMKYSPMGAAAAVALSQYQVEIRNLAGEHGHGVSFVCALSEYLGKDGTVLAQDSPYYYIRAGSTIYVKRRAANRRAICQTD